jgi:hypothetical protein
VASGGITSAMIQDGTVAAADLANGAVTREKLSASGGSNGQVLKLAGGALAWGTDEQGGLTLPYSGSGMNSPPLGLFSVSNEGSGYGLRGSGGVGSYEGYVGYSSGGVFGRHVYLNNWGYLGTVDHGVRGNCSSANCFGVLGEGVRSGVRGNSTDGEGVHGNSTNREGVFGYSQNGWGVFGQAPNNDAVRGESAASAKSGVYGGNSSSGGYGVFGRNSSNGFFGYLGGPDYPVYGERGSGSDGAIKGTSTASQGTGVKGVADNGTNAWGVAGISAQGYGVYGSSTTGKAGFFSGNVQVTGTLSKGGGSFKIDHPLDPEHRYLSHSFVESPDMLNVYNGNVRLNERGEAWVELPDWFEALNRDFRYQLTAIGAPGPDLYIAQEIAGNRFKIAGGRPGMKVSWQVTGIRQDPFANAHRIPVEEDKPADEQGTYLHPEAWGQPVEMGVEWRRAPEKLQQLGLTAPPPER